MRTLHTIALRWLIVLFCAGTSAQASVSPQLHPNLARGAGNHTPFDRTEWDKVNVFNGNLQISIPLGLQYSLTQNFKYRLVLNYNSNIWSYQQTSQSVVSAFPNQYSNAGLGWDLSLGRLIDPFAQGNELRSWVYVSPDGAAHPFYTSLHGDVPELDDNVFYTRDSTYYRLNQLSATTTTVEAADRTIRTFELSNNEWRLVKIADRFNNYLSISYATPNVWSLTDNHGRTHTVYFKADPTGYYPAIIDRVVLASFAGTQATYNFTYTTGTIPAPTIDNDPATPAQISLPVLSAVTAPDGSKHTFANHWRVPGAGRLASMQLPTLGRIEYSYQTYPFTSTGCPTALGALYKSNVGVARRDLYDASGTAAGTWTFTPRLNPLKATVNGQEVCQEERELIGTVQTPVGDKTEYYFIVNTLSTGGWWHKARYGMPGTDNFYDATQSRNLANATYDCDGAGSNCRLVRTEYVRYEQDAYPDPSTAEVAVSTNRREASVRTMYQDDVENGAVRFADVDRTDFDGLGHYRRTVTNGNFGKGDVRDHFINFNASKSTYPSAGYAGPSTSAAWLIDVFNKQTVVEGNSSQTMEFCHDPNNGFMYRFRRWRTNAVSDTDVITLYSKSTAGEVAKEQYYGGDVQPVGTGGLCSLALPATDQYQVRHQYQYGALANSRFYTATGQTFDQKFVDQDIDQNTGLAKTRRDTSGLATLYEYDAIGRITWAKPAAGQGAWKQYRYTAASGPGESGRLTIYNDVPNGGGPNAYTARQEIADSFGRPWQEKRFTEENVWVKRYTLHNAQGWLTDESEYSAAEPRYKKYLNLDPFGRARTVSPPDGALHNITYEYAGVRSVKRTVPTAVSYNKTTGQINEQPRSTTEVYDRQGRLWKEITHTIDQFGSPKNITDEHVYNVEDRRLGSYRDGALMGSSVVYDGRGFLTSAFTQDNGAETTTYLNIDAFGRPQKSQRYNHALNSVSYLGYVYDRASRLNLVRDPNNTSRLWKEFIFADTNGTNDWRAGKLWKTKRYNDMSQFWSEVGVATVSETYTYGGKDGRLSRHDIGFTDQVGRNEKFFQTYVYDELGNTTEIGYPNSDAASSITIGRTRKITNTYSRGNLTAVSGTYNAQSESWATAISYYPFGLNKQVVHANGVTDNIAADANGMARPASVTTTGATDPYTGGPSNFNSGAFQFDGQGTLVKAGSDVFVQSEGDIPPPAPPPYQSLCSTGWRDPFGLTYAAYDAPCSEVRVFYYYTATDRLFKLEDGVREEKVWYFLDLKGKPLTTHTMIHGHKLPWANTWQSTIDYIYRGKYTLATDEKRRDDAPRIYHYHVGHGAKGMRTDLNGKRIE
jgi:hypothetical protein